MIQGNPSTLKMHMTGMESFNVSTKRGAGASIPLTQTTGPNSVMTGDSQSQVLTNNTINTNKSNMRKEI